MRTLLLVLPLLSACATTPRLPAGSPLVSLHDVDPSIVVEARYAGNHNFVGRPVRGYRAAKCLLAREAATALAAVQADARPYGLTLKTYDCYRPQRGVNDFIEWAKDPKDQKTKAEFYPRVDKKDVFKLGYVASKSGHSRGATVDLTLVPLPVPAQRAYRDGEPLVDCTARAAERFPDNTLDMGTGYDCFDEKASTASAAVGPEARRNRLLLKTLMEKHGFKNYEGEWWHYTLKSEPYPDTYFDTEIE